MSKYNRVSNGLEFSICIINVEENNKFIFLLFYSSKFSCNFSLLGSSLTGKKKSYFVAICFVFLLDLLDCLIS